MDGPMQDVSLLEGQISTDASVKVPMAPASTAQQIKEKIGESVAEMVVNSAVHRALRMLGLAMGGFLLFCVASGFLMFKWLCGFPAVACG